MTTSSLVFLSSTRSCQQTRRTLSTMTARAHTFGQRFLQ